MIRQLVFYKAHFPSSALIISNLSYVIFNFGYVKLFVREEKVKKYKEKIK